jgi:hypothetical protein
MCLQSHARPACCKHSNRSLEHRRLVALHLMFIAAPY